MTWSRSDLDSCFSPLPSLPPPLDGMAGCAAFHAVSPTVGRYSVSALDSGLHDADFRPGCIIVLCSWSK